MTHIHPTAVIDPGARLDDEVTVGPYCVIGPGVTIRSGCRLHSHVVADGLTEIGMGTEIFSFAAVGTSPQDKKFAGEESRLTIGARNIIREHVTIHSSTQSGDGATRIGSDGMFMVGVHIAHDCRVGDGVTFANNATLGGHCVVEDRVILGGLSAIHQFVRVGEQAFIGGMAGIVKDIIPFGMAVGVRGGLSGLNLVGLKRSGYERDEIHNLRRAYGMLFAKDGTLKERLELVDAQYPEDRCVQKVLDFIRADSSRSFCFPESGTLEAQ